MTPPNKQNRSSWCCNLCGSIVSSH